MVLIALSHQKGITNGLRQPRGRLLQSRSPRETRVAERAPAIPTRGEADQGFGQNASGGVAGAHQKGRGVFRHPIPQGWRHEGSRGT